MPLTLLSAPEGTELLVIEMGANHIGEIRTLCLIAKPDYGIITNIGTAHLEGFGSFEGVVKAKTELYEHLRKVNGIAIFNDRNPLLSEKIFRMVNRAVPYSDPTGTVLIVDLLPSDLLLSVASAISISLTRSRPIFLESIMSRTSGQQLPQAFSWEPK